MSWGQTGQPVTIMALLRSLSQGSEALGYRWGDLPDVTNRAMATAILVLMAILLSCLGVFGGQKKADGDRCSHHAECYSDCCLMNLNSGGAFCTNRAGKNMPCLPQTKRAINIMCPCRWGLFCTSKYQLCPRRCHWI